MRGGGWAGARTGYGTPGTTTTKVAATKTMRQLRGEAAKRRVPWPNAQSKRARTDKARYSLYHMYATGNSSRTWKYGITRVGTARPDRQGSACARGLRVDRCSWVWVRQNIRGWFRARQIEAIYALKYKAEHGKCPPGMVRCL